VALTCLEPKATDQETSGKPKAKAPTVALTHSVQRAARQRLAST